MTHSKEYLENQLLHVKVLKTLDNIHAVFAQEYEKIEFDEIVFHALPHINDESKIDHELERLEQSIEKDKKNIMMMHCSVGAFYLMQEFGEWNFPKNKEYLFDKMDYVALGHWHGFGSINKNYPHVCYSGSLERTSSSDKRNDKGYVQLHLELQNAAECEIVFHKIKIRKSHLLVIDCSCFEKSLEKAVEEAQELELENALLEIRLMNLTATKSIDISNNFFKPYFEGVMHLSLKREFIQKDHSLFEEVIESVSLQDYFCEQLEENIEDKTELLRLQNKVKILFAQYEESNNDTV